MNTRDISEGPEPDEKSFILTAYGATLCTQELENDMLAIRLPKDIEFRLRSLAAETGRTKAFYVREAILKHIDEMEDKYLAINRLENSGKRWTLKELEQNGVVMRDYPKK